MQCKEQKRRSFKNCSCNQQNILSHTGFKIYMTRTNKGTYQKGKGKPAKDKTQTKKKTFVPLW